MDLNLALKHWDVAGVVGLMAPIRGGTWLGLNHIEFVVVVVVVAAAAAAAVVGDNFCQTH